MESSGSTQDLNELYDKVERVPFPQSETLTFSVKDENGKDLNLQVYEMPTKGELKAVVLYSHIFGMTVATYGHLFKDFPDHGIAVYAIDRRGFGLSDGERGSIGNRLNEDQLEFFDKVIEQK